MPTPESFDSWGVVEAMGFKKLAGRITEQQIAGSALIRVDVPEIPGEDGSVRSAAYSKLIGVGSIYMITPTDEDTARKAAAVLERGASPLPVYIPPAPGSRGSLPLPASSCSSRASTRSTAA